MKNPSLFHVAITLTLLQQGCSGPARPMAPAPMTSQTTTELLPNKVSEQEAIHPLIPEFRKLGEAIAKFWRLERRYPNSIEELRSFTEEYQLDIQTKDVRNLTLKSMIYGRVLVASFSFVFPDPSQPSAVSEGQARVELDSTNPEVLQFAVEATPQEGEAYLQEAIDAFLAELNANRMKQTSSTRHFSLRDRTL